MSVEGFEAARAQLSVGRSACVWQRFVADTLTPVAAASRLMAQERGDYLLESVEGGEKRGRHSVIGLDPDLVYRAKEGRGEINREWRIDRDAFVSCPRHPLERLRELHHECRFEVPSPLPPALATLVGYMGFEAAALAERLPVAAADPLVLPDLLFVRPAVILIFDHLKDEAFCVAPVWHSAAKADQDRALVEAERRIADVANRLNDAGAGAAIMAVRSFDTPGAVRSDAVVPPDHYRGMVERAKIHIEAGDIFQVVLAQRFTAPFPLRPMALYRALRRVNPSPFLYFLDLPGFALVGSSPEILVRVRDGEVTIRPIAGTRPRGLDPQSDLAAEAELTADPKERSEHLMLLDLGRNDVGRVAKSGSVRVTSSYAIERYSHVMHMVSNVVGKLAAEHDALDAVLAGFPAGTVSGAPKIRACEIIASLEGEVRGPYGGALGYFAPDGSVDTCIVLRTAVLMDGFMHVTAGAGIVNDSVPELELRECEAKAGALFAAAAEALALARRPGTE